MPNKPSLQQRQENQSPVASLPGYWSLINAGEPFRLLFPLGAALGLIGVLLWPAYALGWIEAYPSQAHARIMVQGFLASFVFGFLGTALPRLLEVRRIRLPFTLFLATGPVLITAAHLNHKTIWGDGIFLSWLTIFLLILAGRFREGRDWPPPGFVLVLFGLAAAWIGTLLLLLEGWQPRILQDSLLMLARLLAWQAFLLYPILGIGAFLLPRFFGMQSQHAFPELLVPSREWRKRALFASICGLVILTSFLLEALDFPVAGHLLRAGAVFCYLIREIPLYKAKNVHGTLAQGLSLALVSLPLGFTLLAIFPGWRLALVHVLFISGFGLVTLIVASRVILGHSGQSQRFTAFLPGIQLMIFCTMIALGVRIAADYFVEYRISIYGWSGSIWALGILAWVQTLFSGLNQPDDE